MILRLYYSLACLHTVLIMNLFLFLFLYSCILYFYDERCKMNFPVVLHCIIILLIIIILLLLL